MRERNGVERLDDWQQVRRKKKHEGNYGKEYDVNGRAITYYVQDFPPDWNEMALWKTFSMYGAVVDVYVARKLNRLKIRFGFVRFLRVRDIRAFKSRLNGILIGTKRIRVNVAKFDRKGKSPRLLPPTRKVNQGPFTTMHLFIRELNMKTVGRMLMQ